MKYLDPGGTSSSHDLQMQEDDYQNWRVDKSNLQKLRKEVETIHCQVFCGGVVLIFVLWAHFSFEKAILDLLSERLHPK